MIDSEIAFGLYGLGVYWFGMLVGYLIAKNKYKKDLKPTAQPHRKLVQFKDY